MGDNTYVGQNCIILPGTQIGANCIIGAGAVVRALIPDNSVVVGNPATVVGRTSLFMEMLDQSRDTLDTLEMSAVERKEGRSSAPNTTPVRRRALSSEILFVDTYSCPQCGAELESGFHAWQGWQQCPRCGRPSLPPQPVEFRGQGRRGVGPIAVDDVLVIADSPGNLTAADPAVTDTVGHVSGARLIFRTGLLVSAGLAFIFFLDHRTSNTVIFAALSFAFFLLLLRQSRRRRSTS